MGIIFDTPSYSVLLLALVFLGGFLFFIGKKYFSHSSKNALFGDQYGFASVFLILISIIFLCLAFFGPKLSGVTDDITGEGTQVAFVVDVSLSMQTRDISVKNEMYTRLDGVKMSIVEVLKSSANNLYALSVFSGEGTRILPFTQDTNIFTTFLGNISNESIVKKGSNIASALDTGLQNFVTGSGGLIVIFSDGADGSLPNSFETYKQQAEQKYIRFLVVGVGTQAGGYIETGADMFGRSVYKMYNGQPVVSKLESNSLKKLAFNLGGEYIEISDIGDTKNLVSVIKKQANTLQTHTTGSGKSLVWWCIVISALSFIFFLILQLNVPTVGKK